MRLSLVLLLSLFALTPHAFASGSCPTVRLDATDSDVKAIPIWDQGSQPACYSYSASFLASIWARKEWAREAPALATYANDPAATFDAMMKAPEKDEILDANNGRTCEALGWITKQLSLSSAPGARLPKCSMYGFVHRRGRQVLRPAHQIEAKMHAAIEEREALPYAIEFCSGALDNYGESLIKKRTFHSTLTYLNTDEQYENFSHQCGFHVAVIVGQQENDGVCQFRIRNSWGTDVGEEGYFWVDAAKLAKNVLRVVEMR